MRRYSDELYHFGIKGMKWGVRKDRNKKAYARARRINAEARSEAIETTYKKYGYI